MNDQPARQERRISSDDHYLEVRGRDGVVRTYPVFEGPDGSLSVANEVCEETAVRGPVAEQEQQ